MEPINFAFITNDGISDSPADPLNPDRGNPNLQRDFLMNPGDTLLVKMHDTAKGFKVVINDLTTHQTGSMIASKANGFAQVNFDPNANKCTSTPYAFHPMYATSGQHTRVPWAAHSYNVAFADEIGHFEYCNAVDNNFNCRSAGVNDPVLDADDTICFDASDSTRIAITGCLGEDDDFDGVPYQKVWPGTMANNDSKLHPKPIIFRSPLFRTKSGALKNYSSVAFEADLPRIEGGACRDTGFGCTNPPDGASFYPFFTTRNDPILGCAWQLGGGLIPGTVRKFGGDSKAEFGDPFQITYPGPFTVFNDFRKILPNNPCKAPTVLP